MTSRQFRRYLAQVKLSPAEVSRRTGVSEAMLSMILAGKREITIKMAFRLAEGLGENWRKFYKAIGD